MALVMTASDGSESEEFRRFEALFAGELDELREHANNRGVDLEDVSDAYFVIVSGETPMSKHTDLQEAINKDTSETREIASVLVDFGEAYLSKDGGQRWWVIASSSIASKCHKRSIGLKQYLDMRPDLVPFQNDVIQWYQTRQMNGNLQRRTMREIKLSHGKRLQPEYYPDKPLDTDHFHDHVISNYIKTAQDEIVEALDLSY